MLIDYSKILKDPGLLCDLAESVTDFDLSLKTPIKSIDKFIAEVNVILGTAGQVKALINTVEIENANIKPLENIFDFFKRNFSAESNNLLWGASCDVYKLIPDNKTSFAKASDYARYQEQKRFVDELFDNFSKSWKIVKLKVQSGKLILKLPEATSLSNGERDLLCFLGSLIEARESLVGVNNVLIVDEVFDYLDDGNLITCQYYVTKFIEEYKKLGKIIFPIILTHLNPFYFKNYCFKDQHIHYLVTKHGKVDADFKEMVLKRDLIKNTLSKYFLHFYPNAHDASDEFSNVGLAHKFSKNSDLYKYILAQLDRYINDKSFDPVAVCCSVRYLIEKNLYEKIDFVDHKVEFIDKRGTKNKIDFADSLGINSPEIFYLLGILYNDTLHLSDKFDKVTPIAIKLENIAIRKLITELSSITT